MEIRSRRCRLGWKVGLPSRFRSWLSCSNTVINILQGLVALTPCGPGFPVPSSYQGGVVTMETGTLASASNEGERESLRIALQRILASPVEVATISVVAKRGIADLVKTGPRHVDDLAQATGANPDALYRVLRLAASLGVLEEVSERVFGTTPYAALLEDGEGSMRHLAQNYIEDVMLAATQIDYSVETGLPAYDKV